jgi:acetyl-CoA carboxylase biotin carboxyl carrier protein
MSARELLPLVSEPGADGRVRLVAPAVGYLTCALERGAALAPGQPAGVLLRLGREVTLVVPDGAHGIVVSARPERVHAPVGYGDVVLELDPSGVSGASAPPDAAHVAGAGPVVRAMQGGRFYRRAAPSQPPFVEVGAVVEAGTPLGLIEVMKTFSHVVYRPTGGLPARARVTRVLAEDGADLEVGTALLEVEPA